MKKTTANEQLKAALILLATELESSKNNERLLMEALKNIFPISLYISLRPDINDAFHCNREDILNYFIHTGVNEINLEKELQKLEDELNYKNDRLELLTKEITALKKDFYNTLNTREQNVKDKDIKKESNENAQKSLLEIHLEDTTYSSDKWEHYFGQYEQEFARFRSKKNTRLLEIGVQNGGSLQCWQKYLGVNSEIVGIDIDSKTSFLEYEGSIKNYVGDATDPDWLKLFCAKENDFDIIIDDGSHINEDIIKTFVLLFKKIKPGGLYICEDLHACYWSHKNGAFHRNSSYEHKDKSAIAFLKEIIDIINDEHWIDLCQYNIDTEMPLISEQIKSNKKLRLQLKSIESIKFTNSMAFIRKSNHILPELGSRIVANKEAFVDKGPLQFSEY